MFREFFNQKYFSNIEDVSVRSASVIVPSVMEWLSPERVVDVGCGTGGWLSVFGEHGVKELLGIDGDYVDRSQLKISTDSFIAMDIADTKPVGQTFDLAISLEAAQYIPHDRTPDFVAFLSSLAPAVLFSSAIPGQPGDHHVNPRWPAYWHEQFAAQGYQAFDPIRPLVWHDERVALHYRQNMFLYVVRDSDREELKSVGELPRANCLTLVDEDTIKGLTGLRSSVSRLPSLITKLFRRS